MTATELAWAAGVFEGEGSVRINSITKRNWGALICHMVNTDKEIIDYFTARWDGSCKRTRSIGARREFWRWDIASRRAAGFLRDIYPYLCTARVRRRADLGLAFQAQKTLSHGLHTREYFTEQVRFFEEMKRLNLRGLAAIQERSKANEFSGRSRG